MPRGFCSQRTVARHGVDYVVHQTSAMVYLAVGILVGAMVLGLFHFNLLKESA
jgi:hypothetical protein